MKTESKKSVICSVAAVVFAIILFITFNGCFFVKDSQDSEYAFEIRFPLEADVTISDCTKKTYDAGALQSKLKDETVYLYSDPQVTDYAIVSQLGFDTKDYTVVESEPNLRWYRAGSGDAEETLEIDKYGCFLYSTNAADTWFEFPFNDEQTIQLAEDFLSEYALLDDSFAYYSIDNTVILSAESKKIVAREVNFFQQLDGRDVFGNQQISVEINGNGEVTRVNYSVRNYQSKHTAELISIEAALQNLDPTKAYVNVQSLSEELIFEDVVIAYWAQNLNYDHVVLQPVYTFSGTSISAYGETETFDITVQANVVPSNSEN